MAVLLPQAFIWEENSESNTTTPGFIRKDPDAGENGGHQEKGATEDEMVGWHYLLNIHEFEQTSGDGEVEGGLACCSPGPVTMHEDKFWLILNAGGSFSD